MRFRYADGEWVRNESGGNPYGYGYIFNSDGTYIFMMALSDIAGQYLGTGVYRGIYRTDLDKLTLSVRRYDFVSRNRDKDTSEVKTGEEIYFYSFGVKNPGSGEGLILQPVDTNVRDSIFYPV